MNRTKRNILLLFLASIIWGFAFVAQSTGGDVVGPYSFNCIRSFVGAIVLIPVMFFLDKLGLSRRPESKEQKKTLWKGGICCGIALAVASNMQQLGITYGDSAGKAGFITACYILIVPILGIFLHKKCGMNIWLGVIIALTGMYLLCINDAFVVKGTDLLLLGCAFVFSIQILCVDHFAPICDGVRLSAIQFLTCGIVSAFPMISTETGFTAASAAKWLASFGSIDAWIAILYAGVLSCGVAYTLQIVGQVDVNPAIASLVMSFESVFSVIGAWLLLGEKMTGRQLLGCGLIFVAIVLAQIEPKKSAK